MAPAKPERIFILGTFIAW